MTDSPSLPPDPQRLKTIRTYLALQLAAVDAAITAAETPHWLTTPATAWRIQHLPPTDGSLRGRGVLHRDDCWITGGIPLEPRAAPLALEEPAVTMCDVCHPERDLQPYIRSDGDPAAEQPSPKTTE